MNHLFTIKELRLCVI